MTRPQAGQGCKCIGSATKAKAGFRREEPFYQDFQGHVKRCNGLLARVALQQSIACKQDCSCPNMKVGFAC